jgi:hypothetical protein
MKILILIILFLTGIFFYKIFVKNKIYKCFESEKTFITFKSLGNYGELGNQLFQLSATLGIAQNNNLQVIFPQWKYITYFPNSKDLKYVDNNYFDNKNMEILWEYSTTYDDLKLNNISKNYDLSGYRQSEKYFKDYKGQILNLLKPDNNYLENIKLTFPVLNTDNTVSIHIRRGDYVNFSDLFLPLSDEYYYYSVKYIQSVVGPNLNLIIVSNDKEWVRNNMPKLNSLNNIYYSPFENQLDDFSVIYLCKWHINANSSFSWWASYLSQSAIIIAPSKYYIGEFENKNTLDMYPDDWILIDNNGNLVK